MGEIPGSVIFCLHTCAGHALDALQVIYSKSTDKYEVKAAVALRYMSEKLHAIIMRQWDPKTNTYNIQETKPVLKVIPGGKDTAKPKPRRKPKSRQ